LQQPIENIQKHVCSFSRPVYVQELLVNSVTKKSGITLFIWFLDAVDLGNAVQSRNSATVSPVTTDPLPSSSATAESESSAGQHVSPNIDIDRLTHLDADDFYIMKSTIESMYEVL